MADLVAQLSAETGGTADDIVFERYAWARLDQTNIDYYRGMLEHKLMASLCEECGRWHTPLRSMCPSCWSPHIGAKPLSGGGVIYLLTRLHQGPPEVDYAPPWPIVAVELDEQPGLRIVGTLLHNSPELQLIGQRVELAWTERLGAPWPAFRVTTSSHESPAGPL